MASVRFPSRLFPLLALLLTLVAGLSLPAGPAQAQDTWQYHMAQGNNYYRNRLLPKALAEFKAVVEYPEGAKQFVAWERVIDIATKLKDIDSLVWALENAREIASGQSKAQIQAQLYRLKRGYGRVVYQATGGSGKLSKKGIKLKALDEISDPDAKAYFEKARILYGQIGQSKGSYYLPAGKYLIDGEEVAVVGGKDTVIEVAPTTFGTFGIEIAGSAGARGGDTNTGLSGFLGGLDLGLGPHIQFSSGSSLLIQAGALVYFGSQSTTDVQQNAFEQDSRARLSVTGQLSVGLEFRIGPVDLSPRIGYTIGALPSGMYYKGQVTTGGGDTGAPPSVLDGEFVVPAIAHGLRIGLRALVSPDLVKGKRKPRFFVGFHAGPLWAVPLWAGANAAGSEIAAEPTNPRDSNDSLAQTLGAGPFTVAGVIGGPDDATKAKIFVDVQAVIGVQVRLGGG